MKFIFISSSLSGVAVTVFYHFFSRNNSKKAFFNSHIDICRPQNATADIFHHEAIDLDDAVMVVHGRVCAFKRSAREASGCE